LRIAGDIEIVARLALDDWTPSTEVTVIAREQAAANRSYRASVLTDGRLNLTMTTDGSTLSNVSSSSAGPWADNTAYWVKVTRRQSDGRVQYFYASDQATEPTGWTQLGTDLTLSSGAAFYSGTSQLEIGSRLAGVTQPLTGRIYRAIVRSGIDGTTVADFDAGLCGQSGHTDAYSNVWTVNRATSGRKAVVQSPVANSARSLILHGTDDSATVNAGVMPPMTATTPASVLAVHRTWGTIAANSTILDTRASNALVPGLSLRFSGETAFAVLVDSASSITTTTVAAAYGAKHVVGAVLDAANIYPVVDTTIGTASARTGNDETGTSTTLLNVRPGPVGYLDSEFFGLIAAARALTAADLAQLVAYYGGGL